MRQASIAGFSGIGRRLDMDSLGDPPARQVDVDSPAHDLDERGHVARFEIVHRDAAAPRPGPPGAQSAGR